MDNGFDLGWVKLHRKVQYSGLMQYPLAFTMLCWFMVKASTKKTKSGMNYQSVELLPGQLIVGREMIARELNQTEQKIRTALKYLRDQGIITSKSTNKFSIITVVNWGEYQFVQDESTGTLTSIQPASNQQVTTYKEVKNKELRINTYSPEFEAFWTAYPYKVGKPKAYKAYSKIITTNQATHALLLTGVERYKLNLAAQRKAEGWAPQFKMPESWLNAARWDDPVYKSAKEQSTVRRGDNGVILPSGI